MGSLTFWELFLKCRRAFVRFHFEFFKAFLATSYGAEVWKMKSAIRSSFPLPITLANHHYAEECVNCIIIHQAVDISIHLAVNNYWLDKKILSVTAIYNNWITFKVIQLLLSAHLSTYYPKVIQLLKRHGTTCN